VKIVFDAFWWVNGPPSQRRILREIVMTWAERYPADELTVVTRKKHAPDRPDDLPPGVKAVNSGLYPQAFLARWAVPRQARRLKADAVITHNFAPRYAGTSAIFLHDVLFSTNPEWFERKERAYFALMPRWAKSADIVFTSSASEAHRIETVTRHPNVRPVGIGLSTELLEGTDEDIPPGLSSGRFILTVGRLNARKNLGNAIVGALHSGRVSPEFPVVVAGAANGLGEELPAAVQEAVSVGSVVFLGHVSDAALRWLYRNCALFVFMSLGEGFGMPPMEALASGARVLVSDLPVMRENVGEFGYYSSPTDVAQIARDIGASLDTPSGQDITALQLHLAPNHWASVVEKMRAALAEVKK
jgi:glycosyltransferase involved in cell wall biosynthesis